MKTDLQHELQEVTRVSAPDLWEEIESRSVRPDPPQHAVRSRVPALTVGLLVAIVAIAMPILAMRPGRPGVQASGPVTDVEALSLWPQSAALLSPANVSSTAAADANTWQLNPSETAKRFGLGVFGWSGVLVTGSHENTDGTTSVTIGRDPQCLSMSSGSGSIPSGGPTPCPTEEHVLTLGQLPTGQWEVVEVHPVVTYEYDLGVVRGGSVSAGQDLHFEFGDVPPGVVGIAVNWGCGLQETSADVAVPDANSSSATLAVPEPPTGSTGCVRARGVGYLFAYSSLPMKTRAADIFEAGYIGEASIVPIAVTTSDSVRTPSAAPIPSR